MRSFFSYHIGVFSNGEKAVCQETEDAEITAWVVNDYGRADALPYFAFSKKSVEIL
jgi:hypothetical protein